MVAANKVPKNIFILKEVGGYCSPPGGATNVLGLVGGCDTITRGGVGMPALRPGYPNASTMESSLPRPLQIEMAPDVESLSPVLANTSVITPE